MLFQNLKAIGEDLPEISVLYCKYIYIFIYIDILGLSQHRLSTADHANIYATTAI
jgi:hypothetical protein